MTELTEIKEGVVVRPGDTLVVRLPADVRRQQVNEIADELRSRLPDGVHVIVCNAEQLGVVQAEEGATIQ